MKRCTLLIPDTGPLNSLWVAGQLDMPIVIVDAVYDEATSDTRYTKDADVKDFIDRHRPPFMIEETEIGILSRERRDSGQPGIRHAGESAIMSCARPDGGVQRYLRSGDPLLVLFEDHSFFLLSRPRNMHLAVNGRIAQRVGARRRHRVRGRDCPRYAASRRPADARVLTDLPLGTDVPADIGSSWEP